MSRPRGFRRYPVKEDVPLPDYVVRGSHQRRSFRCHIRRGRRKGAEFVFAEVWWGKQSIFTSGIVGLLGLLRAALHMVVGLRVVLRTNQGAAPLRMRVLRALCWTSSLTLVGPVFALNVLLLIGVVMLLVGQALQHLFGVDATRPLLAAGGLCALVIGAVLLARIGAAVPVSDSRGRFGRARAIRSSPFRQELWACLCVAGVFAVCLVLFWDTGWSGYGAVLIWVLIFFFGLASASLACVAAVFLLAFAWRRDPWYTRAESSAVTVALQSALWIVLVPNLWGALIFVIPGAWLGSHHELVHQLLEQSLVARGVHWVIAFFVGLVFLVHFLWRKQVRPSARLILARGPSVLLMIGTLVATMQFLAQAVLALMEKQSAELPWWLGLPAWRSRLA